MNELPIARTTVATFLALILGGPTIALGQDHLGVPSSVLSGFKSLVDYDRMVRDTLLARTAEDPYVRAIVEPSFQSEWVVDVTPPTGGVAQIQLVVATRPVWNGGTPLVQPIQRSDGTLTSDLAERLRRIWLNMLQGVRPSAKPRLGLDGVNYHFAAFVQGEGILAGEVWTPATDTRPERLVRLAMLLREVAEAPSSRRASLLNRLRSESEAFARILGVDE